MPIDSPTGYWTWAEFNAAVDELCPLECQRLFGQMNADGSSVYYRNQIRQAVLDLARFIPEYTRNHEAIYYPADLVPDGTAHVGTLPPLGQVESAWFYRVDRQQRFPVAEQPWAARFSRPRPGFGGNLAISPKHDQFYLYPQVSDGWVFSLFWDGQKLDYRAEEQVPFAEAAALAAAHWTQSQFASYVDRDLPLAAARMQQYYNQRSNLYLDTLKKGQLPSRGPNLGLAL